MFVCQPTTCTTAPPSTSHIFKGTHWPRCRCQCHACSSVQTANRWYRTKEPWPCTVHHEGVHHSIDHKLGELASIYKVSWMQTRTYHIQHHRQEGSVLLSCEDVLKLHLITPQPGLEHMVEGSKLIASQADINQVSNKTNMQELSQELATPKTIMCKEDIRSIFPML